MTVTAALPLARGATGHPVQLSRRAARWGYLPGLEGVRALAVVAVVVFHLGLGVLPGGFLGVDVFFTLSGFLITSLLLVELRRDHRVRFGRFYLHRARRLLPGLFLMLLVTAAAVAAVAPDAAETFRQDAVATLSYSTNWWYVVHQVSYFESTGRPPLLQHTWSLAIEEQFYLIWPLLLFGLWRVGRVRAVRVGAVVGASLSTVLMAWLASTGGIPESGDPSRIYFGSDTHAMNLLVGAALAGFWSLGLATRVLTRRGHALVAVAGAIGLAGLFAAFLMASPDSVWLYRGGFLAVGLAAAALIAAASVTGSHLSRVLAAQPLRWIGQRSYGIYLWHWPVFMLLRPGIDVDGNGWAIQVARLATVCLAAELSYRFVETPIRGGALGRIWIWMRSIGKASAAGFVAASVLTAVSLLGIVGQGLASAHSPTVEDALGGVTAVGDEPLTPIIEPTAAKPTRGAGVDQRHETAPPEARAPRQPTAGPSREAVAVSATAVGDSVMLGARDALNAEIPKLTVDAAVGRQSPAVFKRIRERLSAGALGQLVIIHTGTNGVIVQADLVALLRKLSDRARVVLVTAHVDRSWTSANNTILHTVAAQFAASNVRLADWDQLAQGHRDWFYADGIHTKPTGSSRYAQLIQHTLTY